MAAFIPPKDRVIEQSTSNSQTVFAVTGAIDTSFNRFSAHMAVGDWTVGFVAEPGIAFKSGILTYSATNQITIDATTGESKGTFSSSGTKEVVMCAPGSRIPSMDGAQTIPAVMQTQLRANISAARLGATARGDSNYTILSTDSFVYTNAALTAARTFTLPAASAIPAGEEILIADVYGGVTATNTLGVARAGSDTINGSSGTILLRKAYAWIRLRSDGSSKWTVVGVQSATRLTAYTSGSGTHTTLIGCTRMRIRLVGGGGGGGGSGNAGTAPDNAGSGGSSTFGSLTGGGGAAGTLPRQGGGGSASGGTINIPGAPGDGGIAASTQFNPAGNGGPSELGVGGLSGYVAAGSDGVYGGGGGGGGLSAAAYTGGGGGGGGYAEDVLVSPATSYSYAVGAGGTAGGAGTNGYAGGAGGAGLIIVEEEVR